MQLLLMWTLSELPGSRHWCTVYQQCCLHSSCSCLQILGRQRVVSGCLVSRNLQIVHKKCRLNQVIHKIHEEKLNVCKSYWFFMHLNINQPQSSFHILTSDEVLSITLYASLCCTARQLKRCPSHTLVKC